MKAGGVAGQVVADSLGDCAIFGVGHEILGIGWGWCLCFVFFTLFGLKRDQMSEKNDHCSMDRTMILACVSGAL